VFMIEFVGYGDSVHKHMEILHEKSYRAYFSYFVLHGSYLTFAYLQLSGIPFTRLKGYSCSEIRLVFPLVCCLHIKCSPCPIGASYSYNNYFEIYSR
jgi:hypothetical protein